MSYKPEPPPQKIEIERPDPDQLYQVLYNSAQQDYKRVKARVAARRSLLLIIILLSVIGVFSIVFYPTLLKSRMETMQNEIFEYRRSILSLNTRVEELAAQGLEYKDQIRAYEDMLGKLKVEDDRIVDFDLTDQVKRSTEKIDAIHAEYRNITRGDTALKETALTFDLGTGNDLPFVYSVLKRFSIRATIFVSNEMPSSRYGSLFSSRNLKYLVKLGAIGCEFGNHTWSHYNLKRSLYETSKRSRLSFTSLSDEVIDEINIRRELKKVEERLYRETGIVLSPLWRAPYGEIDNRVLTVAAASGYPNHIFWSANRMGPLDFYDYVTKRFVLKRDRETGMYIRQKNPYYFTSQEMLARMKQWESSDPNGLNGAISIAHLGTGRKSDRMALILPEYISYFKSRGYRFVTVSEVINGRRD
jgi:peptidoglycan/xylan/chitin deacetylase (PgdA/CDA1 family)